MTAQESILPPLAAKISKQFYLVKNLPPFCNHLEKSNRDYETGSCFRSLRLYAIKNVANKRRAIFIVRTRKSRMSSRNENPFPKSSIVADISNPLLKLINFVDQPQCTISIIHHSNGSKCLALNRMSFMGHLTNEKNLFQNV